MLSLLHTAMALLTFAAIAPLSTPVDFVDRTPATPAHIDRLRREVARRPNSYHAQISLGDALEHHELQNHKGGAFYIEAIGCFERALEIDPNNEKNLAVRIRLGSLLSQTGKQERAMEVLGVAVDEATPNFPELEVKARFSLHKLYHQQGDKRTALVHLLRVMEKDIGNSPSYQALSDFSVQSFLDHKPEWAKSWTYYINAVEKHVLKLEGSTNRKKRRHLTRMYFSLFQAYHSLANHRNDEDDPRTKMERGIAFVHLRRGNELMRSGTAWALRPEYDREFTAKNFAGFKHVFQGNFWSQNAGFIPNGGRNVVFVVGLPRSGTTLVEQMLHAHSQVNALGEDSHFNAALPQFRGELAYQMSSGDARSLKKWITQYGKGIYDSMVRHPANSPPAPVLVDKMLFNFMNVGFIHLLLPTAPVIHMYKANAKDALFSLFRRQFEPTTATWSYDLGDILHYYNEYQGIMNHWREQLPGRVLDVAYEDLVLEPEKYARKIMTHCGLEWEPEVLEYHKKRDRAIMTQSMEQVHQPIFTHSIGAWKKYESGLLGAASLIDELNLLSFGEDADYGSELKHVDFRGYGGHFYADSVVDFSGF